MLAIVYRQTKGTPATIFWCWSECDARRLPAGMCHDGYMSRDAAIRAANASGFYVLEAVSRTEHVE